MVNRPTNRRYTEEFKADAVALLRSLGKPIADVARELGVTDMSPGNWAREAAKKATPEQQNAAEQAREEARLRKRVRELERQVQNHRRVSTFARLGFTFGRR